MRLKPDCVRFFFNDFLPSFVGDNPFLFCCFPSLVGSSFSLFISYGDNIAAITFFALPTWCFSSLLTIDCFWTTCSLKICTSCFNFASLSSLVILLNIVVSGFSLPILGISHLHQKLWKSQKWNPHLNLRYHSKKISWIGFHHVFINLLLLSKFVEWEFRKETRIKIVKANNLIKKHNNWTKLQVDEKLFLHSSMLKNLFFLQFMSKNFKINNLHVKMHSN